MHLCKIIFNMLLRITSFQSTETWFHLYNYMSSAFCRRHTVKDERNSNQYHTISDCSEVRFLLFRSLHDQVSKVFVSTHIQSLFEPVTFIYYIFRDPDLIWPSKNTSYETDRVLLRNFDHIDEFVDEFRQLDPENILNRHMATRLFNGENTSGLSMGRIFAFRLYLESYDKRRYNYMYFILFIFSFAVPEAVQHMVNLRELSRFCFLIACFRTMISLTSWSI